jgi:predicted DNA-binding transcriptional regulator YafY
LDFLRSCEISAERRSIYKDINEINKAILIAEGVAIDIFEAEELCEDEEECTIVYDKHRKGFYVRQRHYEANDIRMMAECVYAARFLDEKTALRLVDVVCDQVSEQEASKIKHSVHLTDRVKTDCTSVYTNVGLINDAMSRKLDGEEHVPEKIKFKYLKCTIQDQKQKAERRNGKDYVVSPHAIIIDSGNYYLLGIENEKKKLRTYRVDRMTKVRLTGERRDTNTETDNLKEYLETYPQRVFSMYGGRRENVRIRFVNTLLDTVYDRFGDYASYFMDDDRHFTVSVSVEISPMFFGWLCGFGNKAVLLSPNTVIEEFLKHVDKMYEKYKPSK